MLQVCICVCVSWLLEYCKCYLVASAGHILVSVFSTIYACQTNGIFFQDSATLLVPICHSTRSPVVAISVDQDTFLVQFYTGRKATFTMCHHSLHPTADEVVSHPALAKFSGKVSYGYAV